MFNSMTPSTSSRRPESDSQACDRHTIRLALESCRASTLALFETVDRDTFCCQAHGEFSPMGWHLGHIGYTEAYWILEQCAGQPPLWPESVKLFRADGLPKTERVNLPSFDHIQQYLEAVRSRVLEYLEQSPLETEARLWYWLLQHESQHSETISLVLSLQRLDQEAELKPECSNLRLTPYSPNDMVYVPAGVFEMGHDAPSAIDNERPVHPVELGAYWIDRYPVTCGQYREFIRAGGYTKAHWWSEAGWHWLQQTQVQQPLYWVDDPRWDDHPVCGVSWYEADAYARFVGKRLPTEAEWEKAASWDPQQQRRQLYPWGDRPLTGQSSDRAFCNHHHFVGQTTPVMAYPAGQSAYGCFDMLGNVWEWTQSWFMGYDGFEPYLYSGYSQVYFDQQHRVLRGGSWATRPWALRCAFRNWYYPHIRQIFAGFRCASDGG